MIQLTIDDAIRQGDIGMRRAEASADRRSPDFSRRAASYMAALLTANGPMTGEQLTEAAQAAGFVVTDARAFGRAFQMLRLQHGAPILRSDMPRTRGHGTSGAKLYGRPAA